MKRAWPLLLLLGACNESALSPNGNNGGDLRGSPSDLSAFCGDPSSARLEVNGMLAASPSVTARFDALDCCEAGELDVVTMQLPGPVAFMWRHFAGTPFPSAITLDLANLPSDWGVVVQNGCLMFGGCMPDDSYNGPGLSGTLTLSTSANGNQQMSVCLSAAETAAAPHPVVHSLRLWSPTITLQ